MAELRFLADESCDFAVVRRLRAAGYNVTAISEDSPRLKDQKVIECAYREKRILLTEDKDFGWLVFVSHAESAGVILIRFPNNARQLLPTAVLAMVRKQAESLWGAFVVIEPGQVRINQKAGH